MTQTIYTVGLTPDLAGNGDAYFEAYCIDEATATNSLVWLSNRFTFQDGFLISHEEWRDDNPQFELQELKESQKNIPYKEVVPKKIYSAFLDDEGLHQFGGEPPSDFIMPEHHLPVNFQYIGYINQQDEICKFLPFEKLHLVYPMPTEGFGMLIMDYSDPNFPKFLEMDGYSDLDACPSAIDDCVDKYTIIKYESYSFSLKEKTEKYDYSFGSAGVFYDGQYTMLPISPITKKPMQLVVGFNPLFYDFEVVSHNLQLDEDDWRSDYLKKMNFGYQMLAVFIEPETKIVAYCPTN